jgi:hypothetical protein
VLARASTASQSRRAEDSACSGSVIQMSTSIDKVQRIR